MALSVVDATAGRSLDAFLDVPAAVYGSRAPSRAAVIAGLLREDCREAQKLLVAERAGRPVARLVARVSPALRDAQDRPCGVLGHFEACDEPSSVAALFDRALEWLGRWGVRTVVGPMDGDTWHRYRLNLGPHREPPFAMEPANPEYYPRLWEACGFARIEEYSSAVVDDVTRPLGRLAHAAGRALDRGYTLRPLRLAHVGRDLRLVYRLSKRIFRGNFLYSDIAEEEFLRLYGGFERLLRTDLVQFARAPDGEPVGFLFAFPEPSRKDTVNYKTVGVLPGHEGRGVGSLLMARAYEAAAAGGRPRGNLCLIRRGNASGALGGGFEREFRRYALYGRTAGA